jgi:hypothetical protein
VPRLVHAESFGRPIRLDPVEELGVPTQDWVERFLAEGARAEALRYLAYMGEEFRILYQTLMIPWLRETTAALGRRTGEGTAFSLLASLGELAWERFHRAGVGFTEEAARAIRDGRDDLARAAMDHARVQFKSINDAMVAWVQDLQTLAADRFGPEEIVRLTREAYDRIWTGRYRTWLALTPHEQVALSVEGMRAHYGGPRRRGDVAVREEPDRYVLSWLCGTGGMLRMGDWETGAPPHRTHGRNRAPEPWTWGRTGVPWYCTHCSLLMEVFPAEVLGHPLRPLDWDPDDRAPCVWYVYKRPSLIRREHYERIGRQPPAG